MITNEFVKTMARYNKWQNESIYGACDGLSDEARKLDRGAFFGSIHQTLCHLYWGDCLWTNRFAGLAAPASVTSAAETADIITDWDELKAERTQRDAQIIGWADGLNEGEISGDLSWYAVTANKELTKPLAEILVGFFNHQTHHRGQAHAMITATGGKPNDTDLVLMPIG